VGVQLKQQRSKYGYSVLESIDELGRLAETAGLEVRGWCASTLQHLPMACLCPVISPTHFKCGWCDTCSIWVWHVYFPALPLPPPLYI
jgi:hypothetical protein